MQDLMQNSGFMTSFTPSATLAITAKAKELKKQGKDVCSMSAGEPDFDTPRAIKDACIKALNEGKVTYTPASGLMELREAVAAKFLRDNQICVTPAQTVVAPGAKFSVFSTIAALCGPGDEVILPSPYWLSYPEMVRATGAKVVVVPTSADNNYELDPAELDRAITDRTRLLILNTPCNPTGAVYRAETLAAIAEVVLRRNIMVLADEIYEKLVYDADKPHVSIASLSDEMREHTVTVNGFSKTYAMTGWRLGYLAAPLWLTKRIIAFQSHTTSNPTTFAQYGALAALRGEADSEAEAMRRVFAQRRDLIVRLAREIPLVRCIRPQGAFYLLCDVSAYKMPSVKFCEELLARELLACIPCGAFGADGCIRLSYACSKDNIEESLRRLAHFVKEL
ncbi:MAG: pyridoxal phosphate-dependent aminotransferase [Victivallaceae bacterium]|nr:pyridoxal phosphate-dependent aminotransferase [Victivallaceae bacterium]